MKKIFSSILLCVLIVSAALCSLSLTACNKNETSIHSNTVEDVESAVAREISLIDGVSDLNDEQIKALTVIVRTRLKAEQLQTETNEANTETNSDANIDSDLSSDEIGQGISNQNINLSDSNNSSESIDSENFERISRLTAQTKNEVLSNGSSIACVCYSSHFDDGVWKTSIKKSQILDYMLSKGINLSNVSTLDYEKFDDNSLKCITIGGKNISYDELKSHFNLSSNKIISVKNNLSSIEIVGECVKNPNCLYLDDLFNINNSNYREILNNYFSSYNLITI